MKLSMKARYGVRALFDLAFHAAGRSVQTREIAARQAIPPRYLEQIFQALRRANLVDARRGPNGGYTLGRRSTEISLGDALRAVEGPVELVEASELRPEKRGKHVAATIWQELGVEIDRIFDRITLEDLCERARALGVRPDTSDPYMYFI